MNRRQLLTGLTAFLAAPALVRAASLDALPRGAPLYPVASSPHVDLLQFWNAHIAFTDPAGRWAIRRIESAGDERAALDDFFGLWRGGAPSVPHIGEA